MGELHDEEGTRIHKGKNGCNQARKNRATSGRECTRFLLKWKRVRFIQLQVVYNLQAICRCL